MKTEKPIVKKLLALVAALVTLVTAGGLVRMGNRRGENTDRQEKQMMKRKGAEDHLERIVCYNVENLFDTKDDVRTNDDDFTPEGTNHWTVKRYHEKQAHISRVIATIGEGKAPMLVGLCEVENEYVLKGLTQYSPMKNMKYSYLHQDSPDLRGIDVALLYQANRFDPQRTEFIPVRFPSEERTRTRDILYVEGKLVNGETLHVFVVHMPSRREGVIETESRRNHVASLIKQRIQLLQQKDSKVKVIVMGDFNDYPTDPSVARVLDAHRPNRSLRNRDLYNLFYEEHMRGRIGSHKYAGEWGMLDQMIVTGSLLDAHSKTRLSEKNGHVFSADFLLEDDVTHGGKKPRRTYTGPIYHEDGYSDHLPIYIDLIIE